MGLRGPAPTPIEVLRMRGSRRADSAPDRPKPLARMPACPRWLDKIAKAKWKELAPELFRLGLLTVVDGDALCVYCEAFSSFRRAVETLAKEGETFVTEKGYVGVHPAVAIRNGARQTIKSFAAILGLDPSSRTRLAVSTEEEAPDEMDEFLNKRPAR